MRPMQESRAQYSVMVNAPMTGTSTSSNQCHILKLRQAGYKVIPTGVTSIVAKPGQARTNWKSIAGTDSLRHRKSEIATETFPDLICAATYLLRMKRLLIGFILGIAAGVWGHWYLQQEQNKGRLHEAKDSVVTRAGKSRRRFPEKISEIRTQDIKRELENSGDRDP